jgi:hypothetical protein
MSFDARRNCDAAVSSAATRSPFTAAIKLASAGMVFVAYSTAILTGADIVAVYSFAPSKRRIAISGVLAI